MTLREKVMSPKLVMLGCMHAGWVDDDDGNDNCIFCSLHVTFGIRLRLEMIMMIGHNLRTKTELFQHSKHGEERIGGYNL